MAAPAAGMDLLAGFGPPAPEPEPEPVEEVVDAEDAGPRAEAAGADSGAAAADVPAAQVMIRSNL